MPGLEYLDGSAIVTVEGQEAAHFGVFNKELGGFEENAVIGTMTVLVPPDAACECSWSTGWQLEAVTEIPIG